MPLKHLSLYIKFVMCQKKSELMRLSIKYWHQYIIPIWAKVNYRLGVGGKYHQLLTMSAANYADLMKTREHILETIYGDKGPAEAKELNEICTSHVDYLWDR